MDLSNKKLRELFDKQEQQVPDFLDWSKMESGIRDKMVAIEAMNGTSKKNLWLNRFLFLAIGFLLALPLTCMQKTDGDGSDELVTRQSYLDSSASKNNLKSSKEAQSINSEAIQSDNEIELHVVDQITNKTGYNNTIENKFKNTVLSANATNTNLGTVFNENHIEKAIDVQHAEPIKSITSVPSIDSRLLGLLFTANTKVLPNLGSILQEKEQSGSNHALAVFVSPGTWNTGWNDSDYFDSSLEQELWSLSFGSEYRKSFHMNWYWSAGLNYQLSESRLDWNNLKEDYLITLQDTIVGFEMNNFSQELTPIYGDTTLMTTAERNVIHYNKTTMLQLPIGIGYQKSWGKLNANLTVGATMALWKKHTGKTVSQDLLVDYADKPIYNNQMTWSGFTDLGLSYSLSDKFSIGTSLQIQKGIGNWAYPTDLKVRPTWYNSKFVIIYNL